MGNVDDIDLDVDLDDVKGGEDFTIEPGRYLMEIIEMKAQDTKKGLCFLYTAQVLDSMNEDHQKFAERGNKVFEIINISEDSKQFWRLKELLGGAFGIEGGKKIPAWIKGKPFTALVFVDDFEGDERNKLKKHKLADGWDGIKYLMDDGELVTKDDGDDGDQDKNGSSKDKDRSSRSSSGRSRDRSRGGDSDEVDL